MAIITEEPDSPRPQLRQRKPKPQPEPEASQPPTPSTSKVSNPSKSIANTANPFHFWAYFVFAVSLLTLISLLLSFLSPPDPRTWFLSLPPILRQHYSYGRTIKVQTAPNYPQVEVFSIQQGDAASDSRVLILHGAGSSSFAFRDVVRLLGRKDVRAVAIDLPGSGFSDRTIAVIEEVEAGNGFLERMGQVYEDIKEKGLFWGFDQLVEQGYVDFEEKKVKKEVVRDIELGNEEMGKLLGQVVDTFRLAPVDLVLHDSALGLSANWISENQGLVRSVVILDGSPGGTAFPLWMLEVPVMRELVLGLGFVFERVLGLCCMKSIGRPEAEAHRILLKGRDGGRAVVGMGKKLNLSFDLSEWSNSDNIKGLPVQVVWSGGSSDKWTAEGRRIAQTLSKATFVAHSGGRWTQEQNAEEVAESIHRFVSSLPKPTRHVVEESMPEKYQESFIETQGTNYHHGHHHNGLGEHDHDHHHHHHHHHGHSHGGYMDEAYGVGHGWGM